MVGCASEPCSKPFSQAFCAAFRGSDIQHVPQVFIGSWVLSHAINPGRRSHGSLCPCISSRPVGAWIRVASRSLAVARHSILGVGYYRGFASEALLWLGSMEMDASFVIANGEKRSVELPCSLESFLEGQGLRPRSVVVELNGEAVAPSEFSSRILQPGHQLEIVQIVAGG